MAYYECECDNFDMTEGQDSFEMNEGIPGPGVPAGGSAGQVLRKTTSADYDTEWDTLDAGEIPYSGSTSYPNNTVGSKVYELDSGVNSLWNYAVQANTKASNALDNEATAYNYHLQYHVGDYCLYQQKLYRCIVETPAAGEMWNSSHWTAVTVGDEMIETASDISVLRNTLSHKADVIYDTASGDIASFPDGADGLPVKDLTVDIEPVQDLHGYSNPWPAGGGKNRYNSETDTLGYYINSEGVITESQNMRYSALIPVVVGSSYAISFDRNDNTTVRIHGYDSNGDWLEQIIAIDGSSAIRVSQIIAIGTCVSAIRISLHNVYISNMQIELGSTATSYAPYSNICPISGWTGTNVIGVGEALSGFEQGALNSNGMNSASDARIRTKNYIPVVPGKTYYIHAFPTVSGKITQAYIYFYNKADYSTNKKDRIGWLQLPTTFTVPNNSMYIRFVLSYTVWEDVNPSNFNPVFLWPNNEKTSVSISWQSEAGTVYGGTLDVTTGVLTVTDANIASYNGETLPGEWISDRDVYAAGTTPTTGAQVVYKLATPQTYQLTPQEVTTLLGQNNVWADTGDSTVEYPCDTKLYIERLTAPEEDDMIANQNIASGVYFMIGNNLYLSTAAILAGDPIKPGTNCTLTNLAAALNALNS